MEMHLVHIREDLLALNDDLKTAKATKNGLAVVGLLFHVGHHHETTEAEFQVPDWLFQISKLATSFQKVPPWVTALEVCLQ